MRTLLPALAAVALAGAGCGVAKDKYLAKELEADKYRKSYEEESRKTADLTRKVHDLGSQVATLEAAAAAKDGEARAEKERAEKLALLADELSSSKALIERAKMELEQKSSQYEQLAKSLQGEIEAGKIELSELRGRTTVKLKDKILFGSGSATIGREGRAALAKVAEALRGVQGKTIRVEGHTDDIPTGQNSFPTNWELSSARAIAVVRLLESNGVDPGILAAAAYSQHQPVGDNSTPEGRSQNRRIEIVLVPAEPRDGAEPTPVGGASPGTDGKM
jgi:chemotaxis protein MotB